MGHAPPVVRLALAVSAGAAWGLTGAPWLLAPPLALLWSLWPVRASRGPDLRGLWIAGAACGLWWAHAAGSHGFCTPAVIGEGVTIEGHFLASPVGGAGPFRPLSGCRQLTVVVPDSDVPVGRGVRLTGDWRQGRARPWFLAAEVELLARDDDAGAWSWRAVRWRQDLVGRLRRLYGERAPLVAALTLARREGLEPRLRDGFARVGIAHLLAISGFHVGVIAGLVLTVLAFLGVAARKREIGAAAAAWAYVAFIGLPDAASRAALMLTLVALARARGRPAARWGPVGAALLILLVARPERLASVGFQLSFAGAAGLVAWSAPLHAVLRGSDGLRCPRGLSRALSVGMAATLATLPIVAWHFERVSLVGIPATLVATPLVAVALTGALGTLLLDFFWPGLAAFLAGGVSVLLSAIEASTALASSWQWAS
ncbi:MAG TPA: ComEC/Rec2 family competence protein, partial [Longimicrobiales bacterium]|nr:ComEC/Rec2 family competence protein [Longimicrobiales bacterium]